MTLDLRKWHVYTEIKVNKYYTRNVSLIRCKNNAAEFNEIFSITDIQNCDLIFLEKEGSLRYDKYVSALLLIIIVDNLLKL